VNPVIVNQFAASDTNITYENVRDRVVALNAYYGQLSYTEINEKQKTQFIDLVSQIGGNLGNFFNLFFILVYQDFNLNYQTKRSIRW
jgi:hypothetical protein